MRNISTNSHAEHPWSYSQSMWVFNKPSKEATTNGNQKLKRFLGSWKFWHTIYVLNGYIGLLFVIYAPPFIKAPLKPWYVREVWPFLYEYFWLLTPTNFKFLQILSQYKTSNTNAWIFVCLFCFVSMIWDTSLLPHPTLPTNEIFQWIRLRLKLSLSKKPTQGKRKKW